MKCRFFFIFVLSVFFVGQARAQSSVFSSELLDKKAQLEKSIQDNLEKLISTQLQKESFSVSANLKLVEIPASKPKPEPESDKKKSATSDQVLGLQLGAVNVEEVLNSYEKELEDLRLKVEAAKTSNLAHISGKAEAKSFRIDKVEISVGLSRDYSDEYKTQFEQWLAQSTKKIYGNVAVSSVSFIEKPMQRFPDEKPKSFLEHLKGLQNILAMLLAGLLTALGLWVLASSIRSAAKEQSAVALSSNNPLKLALEGLEAALSRDREPKVLDIPPEPTIPQPTLDSVITKIAFLCLELKNETNSLVKVWIDSGETGFPKVALLIDTVMMARERFLNQSGALPMMSIPLDKETAAANEESLIEAYREVRTMNNETKYPILQQIYWEMLSVKTLGLQSLRRPFDYLNSLESKDVIDVLQEQPKESRALALMYMNEKTRTEVFDLLNSDQKTNLVSEVLSTIDVNPQEIWDSDTSVKVSVMNQNPNENERLISLFPRTIEVLSGLNSVEEMTILRKVVLTLPDQGSLIKRQYPSLAFIDEWKSEYLRKLMDQATTDEITSLIQLIPSSADKILPELSPKQKVIVEDDLRLTKKVDVSRQTLALSNLKKKWIRTLQSEKINLNAVIPSADSSVAGENAA